MALFAAARRMNLAPVRVKRARGDGVSPTTARKPHCLIHKTVLKSI
jgi:hypothetical protein